MKEWEGLTTVTINAPKEAVWGPEDRNILYPFIRFLFLKGTSKASLYSEQKLNGIFVFNSGSKDRNLHVPGAGNKRAGKRKVIRLKKVAQVSHALNRKSLI